MITFYCPDCDIFLECSLHPYDNRIRIQYDDSYIYPRVGNIRDGWGRPLYHCQCPKCKNYHGAAISFPIEETEHYNYIRSVVKFYAENDNFMRHIKDILIEREANDIQTNK